MNSGRSRQLTTETLTNMNVPQMEYAWTDAKPPHAIPYIMPVLEKLLHGLPPSALVLDAGCGNGAVLERLTGRGWNLRGLEISRSGIEQSSRAHPEISVEQADLTASLCNHPLWGLCDAVISIEVVEHLFFPRLFAHNCYGFLKPGGRFVLSTPYHGYLKNAALALTGKMDAHFTALWDCGHIKFWSSRTLSTLLTEQGFQDLKFHGAGRLPYMWKSMLVLARKPLSGVDNRTA